jgi:hypothetical protein
MFHRPMGLIARGLTVRGWAVLGFSAVGLASNAASAGFSQSLTPSPGGLVQTGVFSITLGVPNAGDDLVAFNTPQDFEELLFSGDSSASANAAYTGSPTVNSVSATAALGSFRSLAVNSTLSLEPFPAAMANGGWKETFTVSNASLTGQQGFFIFQVRVRGSEQATGISGSALLTLHAYKNNQNIPSNAYFNSGNSDSPGVSIQFGRWGLATYGNPNTDSRTIDDTVTFSVPITFGQPFTLGVYALTYAGLRSSGGFGTPCTSRADFSGHGVTWNGITAIRNASGTVVAGSTIETGSGVDWTNPYNPCVADVDDGNGTGVPDGGVTIDDLIYYLTLFGAGDVQADVDDGSGTGAHDGGVTIDDLLYYLDRFEAGC